MNYLGNLVIRMVMKKGVEMKQNVTSIQSSTSHSYFGNLHGILFPLKSYYIHWMKNVSSKDSPSFKISLYLNEKFGFILQKFAFVVSDNLSTKLVTPSYYHSSITIYSKVHYSERP